MEEMKAKGSASAGEDLISKLPDSLISQILLYLPTKEAVRTCVLSNRWKSLWLLIPRFDLDSCEFPDYNAFVNFMDRFLDFSREHKSCLHKFKLRIQKDENDQFCVTRWIDFVVTRKLKHLDVECGPVNRECLEVIPLSLYICETLLFLRLHRVLLGNLESVSLPCVKTLCLEHIVYANEAGPESLISSCPVLEDLSIVRRVDDNVKVLRVHSQTLTSLSIELGMHDDEVEALDEEFEHEGLRVFIDASRLKYLNLDDDYLSECKTRSNWCSLTKVNILGNTCLMDSDDEGRHFFTSISGVRDMKISLSTYELIESIVPLSWQFCNLSCLEAELSFGSLRKLPMFLASCPNLRSLILDLFYCSLLEQIRLSSVPRCLLSSLESVEIKSRFTADPTEMEVARYFAENSVILKKLVLRLKGPMLEDPAVFRDLLALPTRSSTCQIVVC